MKNYIFEIFSSFINDIKTLNLIAVYKKLSFIIFLTALPIVIFYRKVLIVLHEPLNQLINDFLYHDFLLQITSSISLIKNEKKKEKKFD